MLFEMYAYMDICGLILGICVFKCVYVCGGGRFSPWAGKIPWRRTWQPTPVFLPGESPWTEEPGGLQSMGSQGVGYDSATKHNTAHRLQCSDPHVGLCQ